MNGVHTSDVKIPHEGQRTNPYRYTAGIIRSFWAWQYLCRCPRYRVAHNQFHDEPAHEEAARWPLVRFEDPCFDGRELMEGGYRRRLS
jgi:hypothetical protein